MEKLISLNDLAKIIKVNKSKLSYYVSLGLLVPIDIVGKTMIFEKDKTITTIKKIKDLQSKKLTLQQIKNKL